jgi:hypothetical protein
VAAGAAIATAATAEFATAAASLPCYIARDVATVCSYLSSRSLPPPAVALLLFRLMLAVMDDAISADDVGKAIHAPCPDWHTDVKCSLNSHCVPD